MFGYLEVILQTPLPSNNSLYSKLTSCANLTKFCKRVRAEHYPDKKTSKSKLLIAFLVSKSSLVASLFCYLAARALLLSTLIPLSQDGNIISFYSSLTHPNPNHKINVTSFISEILLSFCSILVHLLSMNCRRYSS